MGITTTIEWTDATWNPVTGCTKISAGCDHCYAERFSERFRGTTGHPFEMGFDLTLRPERLDQPLRWRVPRMIFVNSMSDLFHKEIPKEFVGRVCDTMERAHWHRFQVLTKRSSVMRSFLRSRYRYTLCPTHMWFGVSVEDGTKKSRIRHLQETPAGIRFLSIEPLIGRIGKLDLTGIDWVIVGGESGPKPHQQVFVITRDLMVRGLIRGARSGKEWRFSATTQAQSNRVQARSGTDLPEASTAVVSPADFEKLAQRAMEALFGTPLAGSRVDGIRKIFDFVSHDHRIVGDAKYFAMVQGERLPSAKFSIIAEHVWLLEKTSAERRFLVFGNDRRVPIEWLERYGHLVRSVEFYFLDAAGRLQRLNEEAVDSSC
jgi:protein gp37